MKTNENSDYYLDRMSKYWKQFGRLIKSSNRVLPRYLDTSLTENVIEETKTNFEMLLKELPFIGGDENLFTPDLVSSALGLAYIRVLETRSLAVDTIGEVINEVYDDVFSSLPKLVKWFTRWSMFSYNHQKKLKAFAEESQLRRYPGNWVMEYVAGDGIEFDFGYNCTECAILIFFQKMDSEDYMPYMCATDYAVSRAIRTGLHRTTTLSNGGECCDFRYKKNQPSRPGLPLEDLPEYQNREP
jgi:hypothetical protein